MRDSTKTRHEIARMYDRDPQGWGVLVGRDNSGFYDVLISHKTEAWQIKEYQVNPYKFVGLGSKLSAGGIESLGAGAHPFGFRPIGSAEMKELASVIDDPRAMNELASKLLAQRPISSGEAFESPGILQGPILQSSKPIEALSTAQKRLDEKLRKQLQRIVHQEFRHTVTPYI